jgi:hypothetical protein
MDIELDYSNGFNSTQIPVFQTCNFYQLQNIDLKKGDSITWTAMNGISWPAKFDNGKIQTPEIPGLYLINYTSASGNSCKLKAQVIQ